VTLDVEKLKFDLNEYDLEKDLPFEKPLNLIIAFLKTLD